jgi:DNA-binding LytR/AlgR family response regulator
MEVLILMRVVLVDDEKPALEELGCILRQFDGVEIIGEFTDPETALEEIQRREPDAVFLDIAMPELDGFALAEAILGLDRKIGVVFATGYDEYAIKAFEIHAVDYILKPVTPERLALTLQRLFESFSAADEQRYEKLKTLVTGQTAKRVLRKVPVWRDDRIILLSISDILYYMVQDREVSIVTQPDTAYKSQEPLNYWESRLKGHKFFRCHKSFLVNLDKVEEIIPYFHNTYMLKLKGIKEEIPVSRNYIKDFREIIGL